MTKKFDLKTLSELLEIIRSYRGDSDDESADDVRDEVMYYLLHERIANSLHYRYMAVQEHLQDEYDDIVSDFFLYLREYKSTDVPYQSLYSIKSPAGFEQWLLSTFDHFLSRRITKAQQQVTMPQDDGSNSTDEQLVLLLSQLIAYCDQTLQPLNRFIFIRSLLSMLDKRRAIPETLVAKVLGMTPINYRVAQHRTRQHTLDVRSKLLRGETLPLDPPHRLMAEAISDDFDHLYPTLMRYYDQASISLGQYNEILSLRQQNQPSDGPLLHDDTQLFYALTPRSVWSRLDHLLR